jgi:hypothetical protein
MIEGQIPNRLRVVRRVWPASQNRYMGQTQLARVLCPYNVEVQDDTRHI